MLLPKTTLETSEVLYLVVTEWTSFQKKQVDHCQFLQASLKGRRPWISHFTRFECTLPKLLRGEVCYSSDLSIGNSRRCSKLDKRKNVLKLHSKRVQFITVSGAIKLDARNPATLVISAPKVDWLGTATPKQASSADVGAPEMKTTLVSSVVLALRHGHVSHQILLSKYTARIGLVHENHRVQNRWRYTDSRDISRGQGSSEGRGGKSWGTISR